MATARRELLLAAIETALNTISEISGLTVERNRSSPPTPADCPLIVLLDGQGEGEAAQVVKEDAGALGHKVYLAMPTIEGWVKADAAADLGPAVNDLYGRVINALEADETFGDVGMFIAEGEYNSGVDREEGHRNMSWFALTITVEFQTARTDAYSAPA